MVSNLGLHLKFDTFYFSLVFQYQVSNPVQQPLSGYHLSEHVWALSATLFYWCSSHRTLVHKDMSSQTCTKLLQQDLSLCGTLRKGTDRICPCSPRPTWSSNLNHTASQLFQVASQRADHRGLLLMASKRLGSPSQVGQKSETVAWKTVATLLSYVFIDSSCCSVLWRAHFLDRGNEQYHHQKVVSLIRTTSTWIHVWCGNTMWQVFCGLATFCSDYSSAT